MKTIATQEPYVEHDCAIPRIPRLLVEVIKNTNGTAAAVESRGNAIADGQEKLNHVFGTFMKLAIDGNNSKRIR